MLHFRVGEALAPVLMIRCSLLAMGALVSNYFSTSTVAYDQNESSHIALTGLIPHRIATAKGRLFDYSEGISTMPRLPLSPSVSSCPVSFKKAFSRLPFVLAMVFFILAGVSDAMIFPL